MNNFVAGMAESSQQSQEGLTQPSSETKPCTSDGSLDRRDRPQQWGCIIGVNYSLPPSSESFYLVAIIKKRLCVLYL
jgi:hypothetical protein